MFFKSAAKKMSQLGKPVDPNWARNDKGKFFRFINLAPEDQGLEGQSGVYVIWHGGVRPAWVFVGTSRNLARDLQWCRENEDIMYFERFGGLFVFSPSSSFRGLSSFFPLSFLGDLGGRRNEVAKENAHFVKQFRRPDRSCRGENSKRDEQYTRW